MSSSILTEDEEIYSSLASSYAESVVKVENFAQSTIANIFTSLLPPVLGKQDIITSLRRYKKICARLEKKLAFLSLITDYVVAAICNPMHIDIFQQDTSNRSKINILNILSREWMSLFQAILNSLPMYKPCREVMQSTLSLLRRYLRRLVFSDSRLNIMAENFSAILSSPISNQCFWCYGLQSVDGKDAPVNPVARVGKQMVHSAGVEELNFAFGPISGDEVLLSPTKLYAEDVFSLPRSPGISSPSSSTFTFSLIPSPISTSPPSSPFTTFMPISTSPPSSPFIGVSTSNPPSPFSAYMPGSSSPPSSTFSAYIPSSSSPPSSPSTPFVPFSTSPPSSPLTDFMPISTSPPSSPTITSLSTTVEVGVCMLHLASLQLKNGLEQIINCGVKSEGIELIITTKWGNYSKVFLGVREMSAIVLSLAGDQMMFLYLTVPGCLAVQNSLSDLPDISVPSMALLGGESRRVVIFVKNLEEKQGKILEDVVRHIVGEKLAIVNQTVGKNLLAKTEKHGKLFSAPDKEATARCVDREERQSGDEGDKVSLVDRGDMGDSSASNYWADPALLIASTTGQCASQVSTQGDISSSPTIKRKADDNNNDSQGKRPLVTIFNQLANHPTESNGVENQSLDPTSSLSDLSPAKPDLLKDDLNASSKSSKSNCVCDDCVYVTKSHTKRTRALGPMSKCKCHPCVLAKPWELVTILAYEGDNYWTEPWIEEMFKDIKNKRLMVKQAANLTGASYGQVYKQYGEWVTRLS